MKRLTKRLTNGVASWNYSNDCYGDDETKNKVFRSVHRQNACEKLAAIEDILGDEYELDDLKNAMWCRETVGMAFSEDTAPVERLRELWFADREGTEYIPKSLALDIIARLCTDYSAAYAEISALRGITIEEEANTFRNKDRRILYSESLLWESIWNDIRKMTPREAASLMGYKAIENCLTTDACNQENTENARVQSEEANMDKPRICEILGVEPGESFYIQGFDKTEFWIMDDGTFATRPSNAPGSTRALLQALDHPERIIRKPRFTEQEVADAKTLCRMWPNGEIKFTRATDGDCTMVQVQGSLRGCLGLGTVDLFPSIKPGESCILNEIAGGSA